eukprot:15340251-Ditylum_brightwellii.AAC.1
MKGVVGDIVESNPDKNSLAIGSYEAACCADICTAYVFGMTEKESRGTIYQAIYQDDCLVIFCSVKSKNIISQWLDIFQLLVNEIVDGPTNQTSRHQHQQGRESNRKELFLGEMLKEIIIETSPFLDMQMAWENKILAFGIYCKP